MAQSGRDEAWLRALSATVGALNSNPRPLLPLSSSYVALGRREDEIQANLLLAQASEIRRTGECKTTTATGKVKKDKWSYEDYCGILTDIIRGGTGSVGVVESIWMSFQIHKPKKARTGTFTRRHQASDDETDSMMLDLLINTLNHKRTDMLQVLAHFASPEVVSRILPSAIRMRSLKSVQVLLEEGADPNICPDDFIDCVETDEVDFVSLLLQSQAPLTHATLTTALPAAIQRGNLDMVQLILIHGADADNGIAVEHAIRSGRTDLTLSLLLCPNPPAPATLAPAVSYAFFKLDTHPEKKYNLIEILMNAGAAGGSISLAMAGAVRQRWRKLVQLFVDKGVSINTYGAEAYRHAVYEFDLETIQILSKGRLDNGIATEIFKGLDKTLSHDNWRALAELILDQGTSDYAMHEALIERVKARDLESIRMLLRHGASADYQDGRALEEAVISEELEFVDTLLENLPSVSALNKAFTRVEGLSARVQLSTARKLLRAGANGETVDDTLEAALSPKSGRRDLKLIKVLVEGGADVSQNQGGLLKLAVQDADDECLQTLLLGSPSPSPSLLSTCIPVAMTLDELERYTMLEILLRSGARGPQVSQALVDSIDETPSGNQVAALLLTVGEGSTSFEQGQAFKRAISSGNLGYLELLIQHNHLSPPDFCSCLLFAIDLPHDDDARLEKIRLLLTSNSDMPGDTGASALRHEMQGLKRRGEETPGVLHLLLEAGADINHNHGRILLDAMEMGLFQCFNLFLTFHPSFQTLDSSFEKALAHALRTFDLRYIHELLKVGMPQGTIDKALLRASEESETAEGGSSRLALLLLQYEASVNYQEGSCIRKAISRLDIGLLGNLLQHNPTAGTLEKAFTFSMALTGAESRYETFRLLLGAGTASGRPVSGRLLNEALVAASDGGWKMAGVCELLLKYRASASYANGTPLCRAIKSSDYKINLVKLLLRFGATEDAIGAALACAFETLKVSSRIAVVDLLLTIAKPQSTLDELLLKATQESICDRDLVKCLLGANASVLYRDGQCILHTIMKRDTETMHLLEPFFAKSSVVASKVFKAAWSGGVQAQSQREEAVLSTLLTAGAKGEFVDNALVESIKILKTRPSVFSFITNLLKAGADVNHNQGAGLIEAASQANLRVLQALLGGNPQPQRKNMTRAFSHIFRSNASSKAVREVAVAFCSHSASPDLTYQPSHGPILWQLLKSYPGEKELLRYLIDAGCISDPKVQATLSQSSGPEEVSLLCWALAQPRDILPDDIIDVLASSRADVNFRAPVSQRTPLQLAILTSRSDSIATLLHFGADPSMESPAGISPLSLSSSLGNSSIVQQLLDAGAFPSDGSLHEAARRANLGVLRALVKAQRDYPCSRFQGRTALAELCLNAKNQPISHIKEAMMLLKVYGDFTRKSNGKSILHYALDNENNAILVTQALLDTFMSEFINEDFNLYENGRLRFSPLAYVYKCQNTAPASEREGLTELLKQFECKDRFWAVEGDQPPDVVGAPADIVELMKYQRRRQAKMQEEDEDHQRRIAQRRAEQAEDMASVKARHDLTLQTQREAAIETARIEDETASRHATIASQRYGAELAYIREVTQLTNQRKDDHNTREIEHRKNVQLLEQGQRDENYNFEKQRREEELTFIDRREKFLTSAYQDRARIDKERYGDQLRLMEAQKQAADASARFQRGSLAQIDYKPDSLD